MYRYHRPVLVALFCGSTGLRSANRATLDAAEAALRRLGHQPVHCASLRDIPIFEPEVADAPQPVLSLREQFETCSAALVAVPEYGGGVAGWAKNALDWMVGSGSLYGRAVAVTSAGTTGGGHAIEQLARTLTWQGAFVVGTLGISSPRTKSDTSGRLTDAVTLHQIDTLVDRLVAAADGPDDTRRRFRAEVLGRLHIDPDDRRPPS